MPFLATVQRGPEVLQVLSDDPLKSDPRNKPGDLRYFATHFTVPAAAEVWVDDAQVQPGAAVPAGAAVYVRLGDAVIGLRMLLATTTTGGAASMRFVEDAGVTVARRLTVLHSETEPSGRGTLAVWLRAGEGLDDRAFAAWRRRGLAARLAARSAMTTNSIRSAPAIITVSTASLPAPAIHFLASNSSRPNGTSSP